MSTAINARLAVRSAAAAESSISFAAWVALGSIVASLGLRVVYLLHDWRIDWATFPMFLGDEGTHGLMAMHILKGARPIFYYGAYYHGAFDAYVTAVLFRLFGSSLTVLRLTPLLFSLVLIAAAYAVGKRMYGRTEGLLAAALVALPSKFVFEWGTLSLCGYCGYAGMVMLLLYFAASMLETVTPVRLVLFGLVAGISVWSNQLSVAYVAVCMAALWRWAPLTRKDWGILALALLFGIGPLVYGNIKTPFSTFRQLGRKALFAWTLSKQETQRQPEENIREREYRAHPLLEVLGVQPGRDGKVSPAGTAAALLLVVGAVAAIGQCLHSRRTGPVNFGRYMLVLGLVGVSLVMGIGGFSGQPVGRYQLPLYPLLAVVAAGWLVRLSPGIAGIAVGLVVAAHAASIATPANAVEKTPVSAAIAALEDKGLRHGFAPSPMYDVVFRSGERIVLVPLDHSRYRPYESRVEAASEVFYIYRSYQERKPAHLTLLEHLRESKVAYERLDVSDFHILYNFQPREAVSLAQVGEVRSKFRKQKFGQ